MSVRFPYFGVGDGGEVLELEPDATDSDVTSTIATLIEVHLSGSSADQVDEFWRHSLLPLMAGLMVSTLGEKQALEVFNSMPAWLRGVMEFERARPAGKGH